MSTTTALPSARYGVARVWRAETFRLRRWTAVWVLAAAWLLLDALFTFVFNWVSYASGSTNFSNQGESKADLLASILPGALAENLPQGMPLFGGALMMVLGAIIAGNGYGWGTWKTVFTQGPSRTSTVLGSILATMTAVLALLVVTIALDVAFSLVIAGAESQSVHWPTAAAMGKSILAALMVMEMWALAGYLLGTVARNPAVSIGLGLVWNMVIENLLRGVGNSLHAVAVLTHFLPGTSAGSLVGRLAGIDPVNATPGVFDTLGTARAVVTVAIYLAAFPVLAGWVLRRRDVA
jgi:ABC-type transport system involved in multi-copper enzyme maturation permease subunit